jgi:hypothetical protein
MLIPWLSRWFFVKFPFRASSARGTSTAHAGAVRRVGGPPPALPADFIAIAKKQKAQDEAAAPSERVGVGGHLVFHAMQCVPGPRGTSTVQTSAAICHTFADFDAMFATAARKSMP